MNDEFILGAYWKHRSRTLGEVVADVTRYLNSLKQIDLSFSHLSFRAKSLPGFQAPLARDFSNLQQLFLQHSDLEPRDYDHLSPTGKPTLESVSTIGFTKSFWDGKATIKGGLEVSISAGASSKSDRIVSSVVISFPSAKFTDHWLDGALLHALLVATVKVWSPAWATVISSAFRDALGTKIGCASIGWMTYFVDPNIASLIPADIPHEPVPQHGVILQTTPEVLSAQNPQHIQTARRIEQSLKDRLCGPALYPSK